MKVSQLVPESATIDLSTLIESVGMGPRPEPFGSELVDFVADLASRLSKSEAARQYPEVQALAFWMRRAEVKRLADAFAALQSESTVVVPGGLVFHVPPANVDTLFVYSWLLSLLVGNANLVRLSSRESPAADMIVEIINEAMADAPNSIKDANVMITYEHDDAVTGAISSATDIRVIWGGDATVEAIRAVPLNPRAREIAFPDRYSYAMISVTAYDELSEHDRDQLAERFYNDAFWFNQLGCSSPRLVIWIGAQTDVETLGLDFFERVQSVVDAKQYQVDAAVAIQKNLVRHEWAVDGLVDSSDWLSNSVVVTSLSSLDIKRVDHPGGGMFLQFYAHDLKQVAAFVDGRDQTLTHFGFETDELHELVIAIGGKGIDRVVPIGSALTFNRYWDGYDLLEALTTRVYIAQ